MWAQQALIKVRPENVEAVEQIFHEQVVPVLQEHEGNLNLFFLEPAGKGNEFVAVSVWGDRAAAESLPEVLSLKMGPLLVKPVEIRSFEVRG